MGIACEQDLRCSDNYLTIMADNYADTLLAYTRDEHHIFHIHGHNGQY
jgi:hypothetical protein